MVFDNSTEYAQIFIINISQDAGHSRESSAEQRGMLETTQETETIVWSPTPRWALVGLLVVPVWILFGNLLVLLAVISNRHLRTLSNCVIASLAMTDFMLALLVVPLGTYHVVNGRWDLGLIPCLIWTASDVMLSTASILHLGAITIHRFLGISYPLHFRNNANKRQVFALLLPTWFVSVLIALPLIVQGARKHEHVLVVVDGAGPQCGIFDHIFVIYSSMVSFFLPLAIMIVADVRSVQVLRQTAAVALGTGRSTHRSRPQGSDSVCNRETCTDRSQDTCVPLSQDVSNDQQDASNGCQQDQEIRLDQEILSSRSSPTTTPASENEPSLKLVHVSSTRHSAQGDRAITYFGVLSCRGMMKLNSRERRAEKTLIWVFVCFVVLWLPFFTTNLIYGICRSCEIPPALFTAFAWLGYISSGVNPCIYTLLNKDFRAAFKRILCLKHTVNVYGIRNSTN